MNNIEPSPVIDDAHAMSCDEADVERAAQLLKAAAEYVERYGERIAELAAILHALSAPDLSADDGTALQARLQNATRRLGEATWGEITIRLVPDPRSATLSIQARTVRVTH